MSIKHFSTILLIGLTIFIISPVKTSAQTTHRAAILMVNFPDNLSTYWSAQTAGDVLVEIANFYTENSYGKTIINASTTDVYGVYTISRTCDATGITGQASAAATSAGVDLSQYDILIPVGSFNCNWLGVYTPGAVAAISNKQVIAHELGHLLGVPTEANFLNCGLLSLSKSGCTVQSYGDPYSIMGNGMIYHMSAFEKLMLQYFEPSNVVDVISDGDYTIQPIEVSTASPQVLRIPTSTGGTILVEYRKLIGFDALLPHSIESGALIRRGNELLDMTPTVPKSQLEPVLPVGSTFREEGNFEITTLSVGPDSLSVRVHFLEPTIDLKVNGVDDPITLEAPANFTISTDASAPTCVKSGSWSGQAYANYIENLSGVSVGSYTYTVTCSNPAGTVSDSVVVNVVTPTLPPSVTIDVNGTSTLSTLAPAFYSVSWTANNASLGCVNSGDWIGADGQSFTQFFSDMPVGNYTYTVTCSNQAGVASSSAVVIVDPMPSVRISSPTFGTMVRGQVSVLLDLIDTSKVMAYHLIVDGMFGMGFPGNSTMLVWDTSLVGDGPRQLTGRVTFANGQSTTTPPVVILVDNTSPSVPTGLSAEGASTSSIRLSWSTSTDVTGVAGYSIYRDGSMIATTTQTSYTDTGLTPSTAYLYSVSAYDVLGNISSLSNSISSSTLTPPDTTSPVTEIVSPSAGSLSPSPVDITATASDNVSVTKVEIYVDSTLVASPTVAPYTYSATLAPGAHTTYSKAYDLAGNVSTSSVVSFTVSDIIAPVTAIASPAQGTSTASPVLITATASDNVSVTKVEIYVDSTLVASPTVAPYTYSATLAPGAHTTYSKAYDLAGNVSTSSVVSFTVSDTIAPVTVITSPLNNSTVSRGKTTTIRATATDNIGVTKVEFYVNNVLRGVDTSSPYSYNWSVPSQRNVIYTLTSKAYDAIGNIGISSVSVTAK